MHIHMTQSIVHVYCMRCNWLLPSFPSSMPDHACKECGIKVDPDEVS